MNSTFGAHEQQVRLKLAVGDKRPVRLVRVLDVPFFGDDALNGVLEADDVVRDAIENGLKRRAILRCKRRGYQKCDGQRHDSIHMQGGPLRPA